MVQQIQYSAVENLERHTGILAKVMYDERALPFDGKISFQVDKQWHEFNLEAKREVQTHQIPHLKRQAEQAGNLVVLAGYIYPKAKELLRNLGIGYLEASGNIFLKLPTLYVHIDTQKPLPKGKEQGGRTFTPTGLKVLFHLLLEPELVNKTQREIAEQCQVGLGNIPLILEGLKSLGYLLAVNKKRFVWAKQEELLHRWIDEYRIRLRPKTVIGNYKIHPAWQTILLNPTQSVWGGEPAADLLTDYLRPEHWILHTQESRADLMRNYGLIPHLNGELETLKMWWNPNNDDKTAPPLLVYAELLISEEERNLQIAKIIFDEYLQPNL